MTTIAAPAGTLALFAYEHHGRLLVDAQPAVALEVRGTYWPDLRDVQAVAAGGEVTSDALSAVQYADGRVYDSVGKDYPSRAAWLAALQDWFCPRPVRRRRVYGRL